MDRFWKCIFDKRSIYYQFKKYYIILFSFSLLRELWNTLLLERSLTHKCRQVFKEGKKIGGVNCSQMIWENVEKLIAKNIVEDSGRYKALISQLFSNCSVYLGRCVYFNKTHINQALKTRHCCSFWAKWGSFSSTYSTIAHNKCLVLKIGNFDLARKSSFLVIT